MNTKCKSRYTRVLLVRVVSSVIDRVGFPRGYRPPFPLKYMEALLKEANYPVKLIDCLINPCPIDRLVETSLDWKPQLVVILSTTIDFECLLKYAQLLKDKGEGLLIVVVGQDVTARPKEYIFSKSPIDIALLGEPEMELLTLLRNLNKGEDIDRIKTDYLKHLETSEPQTVLNLDELPFSNYSPIELRKYSFPYPLRVKRRVRWGHILSSRGCPYQCIFCSQTIRESYGEEMRLRSPHNVVDELEYLIKIGANVISFDDDNFTTSTKHVLSICNEIRRRRLKINWIAHARVDNLDFDLLKAMKNAGCILLRFGIESGSKRVLRILKKTESEDWINQSKKVFHITKKLGIGTAALFIVGSPTETKEEIGESIKLAKELDPDLLQVSYFTPYPGSSAYREFQPSIDNKMRVPSMYHYASSEFNPSSLGPKELRDLYKAFYKEFLLRPGFAIRHLLRYKFFYLFNSRILYRLLKITTYFREQ